MPIHSQMTPVIYFHNVLCVFEKVTVLLAKSLLWLTILKSSLVNYCHHFVFFFK